MKTALDTNVLIYFLGHSIEFGVLATDIIESSLRAGEVSFSAIAIAEYLSHPSSNQNALQDFLAITTCVPVSEKAAIKAAEIRRKHKSLRLPDALHLASAIVGGADTFITHDTQLIKLGAVDSLQIKPMA